MATDTPAEQTFEQKVSATVNNMTQNSEGKWEFGEGEYSEEMKFAAMAERRRRDTQAEFSKKSEEVSRLTAENSKLTQAWQADSKVKLTEDEKTELEALKHEDPDAWRIKMNEYEARASTEFAERRETIKGEAQNETELERRTRLLSEHNEANPDKALTDDVVENDLPPRFAKELEAGTISFEEFIQKASDFLGKGKVIDPGKEVAKEPSLSQTGGGSKPSQTAIDNAITQSYKDETY